MKKLCRWCRSKVEASDWVAHRRRCYEAANPERGWGGTFGAPTGWSTLRKAALERAHGQCEVCGAPATEVHHVVPAAQGGSSGMANLRAVCHEHHPTGTQRRWDGS